MLPLCKVVTLFAEEKPVKNSQFLVQAGEKPHIFQNNMVKQKVHSFDRKNSTRIIMLYCYENRLEWSFVLSSCTTWGIKNDLQIDAATPHNSSYHNWLESSGKTYTLLMFITACQFFLRNNGIWNRDNNESKDDQVACSKRAQQHQQQSRCNEHQPRKTQEEQQRQQLFPSFPPHSSAPSSSTHSHCMTKKERIFSPSNLLLSTQQHFHRVK